MIPDYRHMLYGNNNDSMSKQNLLNQITKNKNSLKGFGITSLSVIGNFIMEASKERSSINILVSSEVSSGAFELLAAKEFLERLLEVPVDLFTKHALPSSLKEKILQEAVHVF